MLTNAILAPQSLALRHHAYSASGMPYEDYVKTQFGVPAANARREGSALFEIVMERVEANSEPVTV